MLVSFDVVQGENHFIPRWQLRNCLVECNPVDHRHRIRVLSSLNDLDWGFAVLGCLLEPDASFAEVHQDLVDRQTMQPGGERGFTTKTADFAKELDKDFLSEVFGFGYIPGHPQAERIYAAVVALVKLFEGFH